ncbi:hypothetical protein [Clostridium sp. UBA1652]|uniref:hypothetical protein n=1 Tax=Clostridium sp. UBA1652 TaxID=1946348 RepID=UPI00257D1C54|nr:hypothetical protein [Clostridium sp. UBA1652]
MKDENGKSVGVLSHIVKTHVSESRSEDMISALTKDLDYIKIDDKLSNEEILSYTNPKVETNKLNKLSDSVNVLNNNEV